MTTAQQLTDVVLARVRDPSAAAGVAIRPLVRGLLDRAQLLLNYIKPGYITRVPFTIQPGIVLMNYRDFAPNEPPTEPPLCLRVMRVTYQEQDLPEVGWRQLVRTNRDWLLSLGGRPRHFARVGNDFLAVFPGNEQPIEVVIYYAAVPPKLLDEVTPAVLRDDRLPSVRALTEVLMLIHQQDVKALPSALKELRDHLVRLPVARADGP